MHESIEVERACVHCRDWFRSTSRYESLQIIHLPWAIAVATSNKNIAAFMLLPCEVKLHASYGR